MVSVLRLLLLNSPYLLIVYLLVAKNPTLCEKLNDCIGRSPGFRPCTVCRFLCVSISMPLLFFMSMCPGRASDGICKYAGFGYFYLPAVISTILTIPTVRKIRAYYGGKRCNAIFIVSHRIRASHFLCHPHTVPSHKLIQIRPCASFFGCALREAAKLGK